MSAVAMKRFKLLDGFHVGPDPSNPAFDKTYEPDSIVESPTDLTFLNVPGYRPKFEFVPDKGELLPKGAFAFDPAKETLEEFAVRMREQMSIGPGTAAPIAPVEDE